MTLTLNNTNTLTANEIIVNGTNLSDLYATKGEIGNNAQITTNTDDIAVLNTKQLQNFNSITAINTDLTNNYQTNTQLSSNFYNKTEIDTTFTNYYTSAQIDTNLSTNYQNNTLLTTNFYNKTEIDTTFTNYYTSTQIDTNLSTNYQTNTQLGTNYYNKSEVDTLIAGAGGSSGYTDTEIDNLLDLRVPKSDFTNRFSTFPIIDCSAPTIIHSGLTLNNETINISPTTGLLFSNQTGGGDKIISVFKNATNYITLQGNKIIANATSDDSLTTLDLNPSDSVKIQNLTLGNITVPNTGSDIIRNSGDANYTLRVRDTQGVWEFRNRNLRCMNPANPANGTEMILHDTGNDYRLRIGSQTNAQVGIGVQYNSSYFLNVGGLSNFNQARVATDLEVAGDINLTTDLNLTGDLNFNGTTANINDLTNGLTFYKATTDGSNVMTVANDSGKVKFRGGGIDAYTASDATAQLLLNMTDGNACRMNFLGIGVNAGGNKLNVAGGNVLFGNNLQVNGTSTLFAQILHGSNARIFERADINNSLNVISTNEINFSLQSNRATDPTTGTIALQLNDTNGITINRAVTNNQTFNSIGNITAEANLNVWGNILFQHSSAINEVLNGTDYDLLIWNGDTDRSIIMRVGAIGSTPQLQLSDANVNLLGHLNITHQTVSTSERVKIDNPDADGLIFLSINGANICEVSSTGLHVNGASTETSDKRLKENIQEINIKKCVDVIKYIKPKTYNYKGHDRKCVGYIADDFLTKKLPDEWGNIIYECEDDYLRMDYGKTTPILWSALQYALNKLDKLEKEIRALKGKGKGKSDSD